MPPDAKKTQKTKWLWLYVLNVILDVKTSNTCLFLFRISNFETLPTNHGSTWYYWKYSFFSGKLDTTPDWSEVQ